MHVVLPWLDYGGGRTPKFLASNDSISVWGIDRYWSTLGSWIWLWSETEHSLVSKWIESGCIWKESKIWVFRLNWKKGKYAEIHDPLQSRKGTDPKHLTFGWNFEMDRSMITTLLVLINYRCLKIKMTGETPEVRSDKRYLKDIPKISQRYPKDIPKISNLEWHL